MTGSFAGPRVLASDNSLEMKASQNVGRNFVDAVAGVLVVFHVVVGY